ncbi:MAG: SIS domain-containing protein [Clostridia bacterium]
MTKLRDEILQQPKTIQACIKENAVKSKVLADYVNGLDINYIVTAARGTSDNACNYFKYICESLCSIPVTSAAPSTITIYGGAIKYKNAVVIGVSQSGKAADALEVMNCANLQGCMTVALTNYKDSPMARAAKMHLYLNVGEEFAIAATKTYTAQIAALAQIAAYIARNDAVLVALQEVGSLVQKVIDNENVIINAAKRYKDVEHCYVLGRGVNFASAQEIAIKLMETTYIKAHAFPISDFKHGPIASVDSKSHIILLCPQDSTHNDSLQMLELLKKSGADITVLTDNNNVKANCVIKLPTVNEWLSPLVYVTAMQLFVNSISEDRGIDAQALRGLKKVTITK